MAAITLDARAIADWPSFHRECRKRFGFPDFYGNNLDAWVDCLSYLRDPDENLSAFLLAPDEMLSIHVAHSAELRRRAPHILEALRECIDAVNERYAEAGEAPALKLLAD